MFTDEIPDRRFSRRIQEKRDKEQSQLEGSVSLTGGFKVLIYPSGEDSSQVEFDTDIDIVGGQSNQSKVKPSQDHNFPFFQMLPLEIKQDIILMSLPGPRIVEFFATDEEFGYQFNKHKCKAYIAIPSFLCVNRECRTFVRKIYQPAFCDYLTTRQSIYINFEIDTILIPFCLQITDFLQGQPTSPNGKKYLARIRNIALPNVHFLRRFNPAYFRGIRRLTIGKHYHFDRNMWESMLKIEWGEGSKKMSDTQLNITKNMELVMIDMDEFKEEFNFDGNFKN